MSVLASGGVQTYDAAVAVGVGDWRARAREIAKWEHLGRTRRIPRLTRNIDSWCYLYFIRRGDLVKIGRAVDPVDRLDELQSANPDRLTLLAAAPAHANLEKVVHGHFADCRIGSGEWFRLNPALADFIQRVRNGENPVALVWDSLA